MWFSFSASFSHSCATLHLLCMREPVGHNFQSCWRRWEGKINWWPFRLITYTISQCHVPSSQQEILQQPFLVDGVCPTMPVDRGLEVCEFQTAQHWDLRNNQLRSTLGSPSDSLGCWEGIQGSTCLQESAWATKLRSKMCGFGHRWFVADAKMSFGWMGNGWKKWRPNGEPTKKSCPMSVDDLFHSEATTTVTVSRFPLFFEVTNLQCSNGVSAAESSKVTKAKPVLTIPADGNVCLFVFWY